MSNSPLSLILEKYRNVSFSERDKGARFEILIQRYLKTDPLYANRFRKIWLWSEFPFRGDFGGKDTGIDLVAETTDGDYWAIQCKCYAEEAYLGKDAVDSFLATSSKRFQDASLKTVGFSTRLWISTTRNFGPEFENTIRNQYPPVVKLGLTDLEKSPVDWFELEKGASGKRSRKAQKQLRPHQVAAVSAVHKYFKKAEHSRGKLIMACGTGKTFTALKIAEKETGGNGFVLCLVPSIALVGQMLREWSADASGDFNAICVCSDAEVSKKKSKDADELFESVEDLALPASTNVKSVCAQIRKYAGTNPAERKGLTVVFSTYHSIDVIAEAQKKLSADHGKNHFDFDLIICDEAHRTTGVTLKNESESAFVRVHDNEFIVAAKRLYMTATPRLYGEESKKKAKESDAVLCSMDDPALYGEEIFRIGFGEAVEKGLLADYKVLVLTIGEEQISPSLQAAIADDGAEINTDDAAKFIGCLNALSKRMLVNHELLSASDPEPMRRAVAFCQNIKISKKTTGVFNNSQKLYEADFDEELRKSLVQVEADHIDGSMGAGTRDAKLAWLKEETSSLSRKKCRILTNVRCLSEGVDVPALDAVLFLSARNSQIDVVQSVGRVMRVAEGKKYGYIIIPVVIPAGVKPEEALDKNDRFAVVWSVLNALRAHDDRFNAIVNKIELNKNRPKQILVGGIADGDEKSNLIQEELNLRFEKLSGEIYVKMVEKVGDRRYWENWAKDVAEIAKRHIERIQKLVSVAGTHKTAFDEFVCELRQNINPSVREDDVVEMLAQHIITRPVFHALFENHEFTQNNAISKSMSEMLNLLEEQALDKDHETLERFYKSVRKRVSDIDNAEGKQKIIKDLYDKFFKTAFPKVVEKLGIVYTPIEIVDFLIHSVEHVLKTEFSRSLADENVHILDPFTGTGTFITRLLQSGIIPKEKLLHKYRNEIHANEIVLLAYYIASVNIENTFAEVAGTKTYEPFPGACLTDTFQLGEDGNDALLFKMFPENSKRVRDQKRVPLRVILGNPPYSLGQKSANDNAQNEHYEKLEKRIAETYAAGTKATSAKSLYDSYIKAFRWASDRIDSKNGGVVAFVTNGAWLDGNAMDGFRKCLEKEFSSIYVFNLRGNQRTSGELSRREGGKIFGSGSRTPISLTILVKMGEAVSNRFTENSEESSIKRLKTASPKSDSYLEKVETETLNESMDSSLSPKFFNPMQDVQRSRANLPHWEQDAKVCFATFRLADSIPQEKLTLWENEKSAWLERNPKPWTDAQETEYFERFGKVIDEYLDSGFGSCVLQETRHREIVENALRHFEGERYRLHAFVVMPNHVHVLFEPFSGFSVSEILHSWKRFSAREINKSLGKEGALWQKESWDRYIRNEKHFFNVAKYIEANAPKLAFLGEAVFNRFNKKSEEEDSVKRMQSASPEEDSMKRLKTASPNARIHYRDIGDYLSREQKLEIVKTAHDISFRDGNVWEILSPNEHGDWINLRNDKFSTFIPLEPEKKFDAGTKSVFVINSLGVASGKDSWIYNFSRERLSENMKRSIDFYQENLGKSESELNYDSSKISWTRALRNDVAKRRETKFSREAILQATYRPFCKQAMYFDSMWNEMTYQIPKLFPTREHENLVICVNGLGSSREPSAYITNCIPDLNSMAAGAQCFPLYYYEENTARERSLFDSLGEAVSNRFQTDDRFVRRDGISDFILERSRELYGERVTKEDIFYYVYGFLHSPDYRREFSADLKKMLPRLPLADLPRDFWAFSKAGRELAELHLNYETAPLPRDILATHYSGEAVFNRFTEDTGEDDSSKRLKTASPGEDSTKRLETASPSLRVSQMRFEKGRKAKDRPDKILYNESITVGPVPAEAYDYVVNGKSAIEWVMERYAITTHKESGIVNDPNLWCEEHGDPAYIVNLLRRVIDLSRKSAAIINTLPPLSFA